MANAELSVMLTAKGNLEGELKSARGRVKELDAQIKQLNSSGQGIGDDLADEYRTATRAAAKLSEELNKVNTNVKKTANESTSAAAKIGKAWTKTASVFSNDLVAGLSGAALLLFAKNAVNTFSQVQDASSALQATFGANGDALIAWSRTSADALNLSQLEALNAAQTFAIFAESAGLAGTAMQKFSIDLATRAADLASYFGGTTADAVTALSSGLAGQSEVLRRYGIFADDAALKAQALALGIYKGNGPLNAQQKILATQAVIMKGSARAMGDVSRTADSMANQIKDAQQQMADFKATTGETISIALGPILRIVNSAAKAFNSLNGPIKTVATAVGLVGIAALIATPRIIAFKANLHQAGLAGGSFKGSVKNVAGFMAGPWGIALAAGSLALTYFAQQSAEADARVQGFKDSIDSATGALNSSGVAKIAEQLMTDISSQDWSTLERLGFGVDEVTAAIIGGDDAWKAFHTRVNMARTEMDYWNSDRGLLSTVQNNAYGLRDEIQRGKDAFAAAGKAAEVAGVKVDGMGNDLAGAADSAAEATRKILPLTRAMNRFGHALDVRNALKAWKKSLNDYAKKPTQETADAAAAAFESVVGTYKEGGKAQSQFVADNYAKMTKIIKDSGLGKALTDPLKDAKTEADKVLQTLRQIDSQPISITYTSTGMPSYAQPGWVNPVRKATGGYIAGPGTGTSDSIPALLSNGEYVLRAAAVSRLGVGNLNRLNHADKMSDPALLARLASSGEAPVSAGGPLIGSIVVNNPSADIDVEKAVTRGLRRAERIRAELAASHG